ncbi:MAG: hypothetical protein VW683_01400 [Betaproteobacteria bacterium]|jgi:hypothetical protein
MVKPDKFMVASAPEVDKVLATLGTNFSDRYILTAAMAWCVETDRPCLLYSVMVSEDDTEDKEAWAQVMYLDDVSWVPADKVQQLRRQAVEEHLIARADDQED